jgi:outer membrane protein assembly factor BamB
LQGAPERKVVFDQQYVHGPEYRCGRCFGNTANEAWLKVGARRRSYNRRYQLNRTGDTMKKTISAAMLVAALSSTGAHAADWPMLMKGPAHTGQAADAAGAQISGFRLAGRFDAHAPIHASPVAVGAQLFVGAENGNLYAIDVAGMKLRWLYHADGGIASTPAVADGVVCFLSRDGRLHAIDAASGAPLWSFRTRGEALFAAHGMLGTPLAEEPVQDPWDLYLSSPLVHGGKVYFGSSDERVYALDAKTGKPAWVFKTGGMVHSSPALVGDKIVVGSWDGAVYALDAASGEERWRFQTRTEQKVSVNLGVQASASSDGDTVYIGSRDGFFYALDAASGRKKWEFDAQGSWVVSTPALDDANVYFGTSDTGLLLALDKKSGKEKYRFETKVWTFASPLRVGDLVVAGSMKGELHAIDAASGRQRWSYKTAGLLANEAGVVDAATGKLDNDRMFGAGQHALYSGMEHVKRLGAFIGSPAWHDGRLVVTNAAGEVLLFEPVRQ